MSSKRKQRELALQVLFVWDANGIADPELADRVATDGAVDVALRERAMKMARGAWDGRDASDKWVERLAPQWPPRRQPAVDRNVIRLGIWELTHADTPPKVVIDEAIEMVKEYSTENSPAFVNGVLDAVHKEIGALKAVDPVHAVTPTPNHPPVEIDQPEASASEASASKVSVNEASSVAVDDEMETGQASDTETDKDPRTTDQPQ